MSAPSSRETFLVTGALGCLGAWTCSVLADEGASVVGFDIGEDQSRLQLVMGQGAIERVTLVRGDITELDAVEQTIADHGVTHVIHLAALQVPFCRADPVRGARVNVVGTACLFEAVRRRELGTAVAWASSAAVYDRSGAFAPSTIYGVYKLANEGMARNYWEESGVASVGLRPFSVYGPGRDQGLTAEPTLAMQAAAHGEPYGITFGGRTELHYAPDVARAFVHAARRPPTSADVFDMPGESVHMRDVIAAIEAAAPGADVTFADEPLPFPDELPGERFPAPVTPLTDGVAATIEHFRRLTRPAIPA
jgi:nucleoside-diphosphate-sugar epimerase